MAQLGSMTASQNGSSGPNTSAYTNAPVSASGGFDTLLGNTLQSAANVYGSQNSAEAQNKGILAGIGTQNQTMGNINNLFGTQVGAGNNAFSQLQKLQGGGANGAAPDYSGFENSPGYQFALSQGQRAIQTGAAANGSAYSPNTLANLGQYTAGVASQNYNNYVQQLLSTAGLGASGNTALSDANLKTGNNISQLQVGSGNAQAVGNANASGQVGSLLNSLFGGSGGGANGSGLLSKLFGGSKSNGGGANSGEYQVPSDILNGINGLGNSDFMNTDLGGNFLNTGYGSQNGPSDINAGSTDFGNMSTTDLFGSNSNNNDYGNFGGFDYSNP